MKTFRLTSILALAAFLLTGCYTQMTVVEPIQQRVAPEHRTAQRAPEASHEQPAAQHQVTDQELYDLGYEDGFQDGVLQYRDYDRYHWSTRFSYGTGFSSWHPRSSWSVGASFGHHHPGTVGTVGTVGMDGDGIPRGTPTDGMRITTVLSMDGDPIRITVILCMDSGDVVTGSIAPITMSYTITEPLRDSLRIVSV